MDMQAYLADLEYLVNIDSGSDNPAGLTKMAAFFSQRFRELGWNVTDHDLGPETGPCVICTNREAEHYDLMLIGHLDTVFPDGVCAERPFYIDANQAFGPGVSDMKHGSLMMYYLMKELSQELNEKLNIVVVYNPDEEIGSMYSAPAYLPYAKKVDYVFDYEAALANGHRCAQRKGSVNLWIDFTGKEGHCGYVFTNGSRSAISEMLKWATRLEQLQSQERNTTGAEQAASEDFTKVKTTEAVFNGIPHAIEGKCKTSNCESESDYDSVRRICQECCDNSNTIDETLGKFPQQQPASD
jgi:glutamate carboxypeptidase